LPDCLITPVVTDTAAVSGAANGAINAPPTMAQHDAFHRKQIDKSWLAEVRTSSWRWHRWCWSWSCGQPVSDPVGGSRHWSSSCGSSSSSGWGTVTGAAAHELRAACCAA